MRERDVEEKEQRRGATADIQSETPPWGRQGNGHRRVTNGDTNRAQMKNTLTLRKEHNTYTLSSYKLSTFHTLINSFKAEITMHLPTLFLTLFWPYATTLYY